KDVSAAMAGGRCGLWRYDGKTRSLRLARALLEPLGLGSRDRTFSLREISALLHPEDLREALAIFTSEPSGVSEGEARLRDAGGGWSRVYLRTAPSAARAERVGVAFDLSAVKTASPA